MCLMFWWFHWKISGSVCFEALMCHSEVMRGGGPLVMIWCPGICVCVWRSCWDIWCFLWSFALWMWSSVCVLDSVMRLYLTVCLLCVALSLSLSSSAVTLLFFVLCFSTCSTLTSLFFICCGLVDPPPAKNKVSSSLIESLWLCITVTELWMFLQTLWIHFLSFQFYACCTKRCSKTWNTL